MSELAKMFNTCGSTPLTNQQAELLHGLVHLVLPSLLLGRTSFELRPQKQGTEVHFPPLSIKMNPDVSLEGLSLARATFPNT